MNLLWLVQHCFGWHPFQAPTVFQQFLVGIEMRLIRVDGFGGKVVFFLFKKLESVWARIYFLVLVARLAHLLNGPGGSCSIFFFFFSVCLPTVYSSPCLFIFI